MNATQLIDAYIEKIYSFLFECGAPLMDVEFAKFRTMLISIISQSGDEKESTRLDWIEQNPTAKTCKTLTWRNETGEHDGVERIVWEIEDELNGAEDSFKGATLREALDSALAARGSE